MNAVAEKSVVVEFEGEAVPSGAMPNAVPVGNVLCMVEVSNVVIGSVTDLFEDLVDSSIAVARSKEESRPMEAVFAELGIP